MHYCTILEKLMATVPIPVPFIIHLDASKIIAMVNLDNPEICPVWQA